MKLRAFTLIEVLTVIFIIGILVSLGAYGWAASLTRSRDTQRISALLSTKNALEQYYLEHRTYPAYKSHVPAVYAARWQLESSLPCQSGGGYLTPTYLTFVPEDPSHKLGSLVEPCQTTHYGQYLYLPTPKSPPATGYYLIARMERNNNVNWKSEVLTKLTSAGYNLPTQTFAPCTAGQFGIDPVPCSHNYFISSSRNN